MKYWVIHKGCDLENKFRDTAHHLSQRKYKINV